MAVRAGPGFGPGGKPAGGGGDDDLYEGFNYSIPAAAPTAGAGAAPGGFNFGAPSSSIGGPFGGPPASGRCVCDGECAAALRILAGAVAAAAPGYRAARELAGCGTILVELAPCACYSRVRATDW